MFKSNYPLPFPNATQSLFYKCYKWKRLYRNFFFSQMATRWRTPSVVLQTLQQSLQNSQLRKNIAFVNIFKFNSTCPVVNWVIHLWIGKLSMTIELTLTVLSRLGFRWYITSGFGLGVHTMQKAEVRVMGGKRQVGGRKFNKILSAREAGRSLAP